MNEIREVTVFTLGDSSRISTWSNVPYFFTETLKSKGVCVNRVDLSPSRIINGLYRRIVLRILRLIYPETTCEYFRTLVHSIDVRFRIRRAERAFRNSEANIFLTFSFSSAGIAKKPAVQFCDWPYDYYFRHFERRIPDLFEARSVARENMAIESSQLVFSLFPSVAEEMKRRYLNKHIYYLGNVVNSLVAPGDEDDALLVKKNSGKLLFIGGRKYLAGASVLVDAFKVLRGENAGLELDIVGLTSGDLGETPPGVRLHGYLDKGIDREREMYYGLLRDARVFVNTNPTWGAFSATVEAMFFYNPVIVAPYGDFVKTFGADIGCGYYCSENSVELLCANIRKILQDQSYEASCRNAHDSVKDFAWSTYIDRVMEKMKAHL